MQFDQLKKNIGYRVQLVPESCRLDQNGSELPGMDDDWIIEDVTKDGVRISNVRTQHTTTLGLDHIHHFTSNPDRSQGGLKYGFLTLNVQIFLQGNNLKIRPNGRPGETVKPQAPRLQQKMVDNAYPAKKGIQGKLEHEGYRVGWCLDRDLRRKIDIEGWEIVVEPDENGVPTSFHMQDLPYNQILVKKRIA